ncbi:MAG: YgjP-like metallopeptidase domain-containing protein [Bifidobacterium sp.]
MSGASLSLRVRFPSPSVGAPSSSQVRSAASLSRASPAVLSSRARPPRGTVQTLAVDGYEVTVVRKRIKNLYLRVRPATLGVEVSAPVNASMDYIAHFVHIRRPWIERQLERGRQSRSRSQASGVVSGGWSPDRVEQARACIESQLPGLLEAWCPVVGRRPSRITLRVMSSRWGSCTPSTARIRLNLQLGFMDGRFLQYVFVHEMTHLLAGGHGADFQRLMDGFLPQWRDVRRELNRQIVW